MDQDKIVAELGKQAQAVARQREDYDAAHLQEKVARAAMLEAVVEAVKPALRALCSRVSEGGTATKDGAVTTPATFRALRLYGEPLLQSQFGPGMSDHLSVYLTDAADLVSCYYHGEWTGGVWKWQTKFDLVTPRQAIDLAGDVTTLLDAVADALEREAKGAAGPRTARLRDKAERITAAARLLRSGS